MKEKQEEGLKPGWRRYTVVIQEDTREHIRREAFEKRMLKKDLVNMILVEYFKGKSQT